MGQITVKPEQTELGLNGNGGFDRLALHARGGWIDTVWGVETGPEGKWCKGMTLF